MRKMLKLPWKKRELKDKSKLPGKLPKEVEEYYQASRKGKRLTATLLGLTTLALTVVLAIMLLFGGRWLYRVATHNDGDKNQPVFTEQGGQENSASNIPAENNNNKNKGDASPNDEQNASTDNHLSDGTSNDGMLKRTPSNGPRVPQTPQTGPSIPNTGPSATQ